MNLIQKVVCSAGLGIAVLAGCASEEQKEPVMQSVALAAALPEKPKQKRDYRKELEQILEEHKIKNIDGFYFYTPEHKQEFFDALQEKYAYTLEMIKPYMHAFEARKNAYGAVVMLPRDRMGKGQGSLLCLFPGLSEYILTKEDLVSEIAYYAGHRAKDNAEGILLCGKKIGVDEINLITPLVYQDILDLRARTYQISEIAKQNLPVSQKFKEALFMKYATIALNLGRTIASLEAMKKKTEHEGTVFEHQQAYSFIEDAVKQARELMGIKGTDNK